MENTNSSQLGKVEETGDKDYPFKVKWGNGLSWSLCKTKEEAGDMIDDAIKKNNTWLTTPKYNRYPIVSVSD